MQKQWLTMFDTHSPQQRAEFLLSELQTGKLTLERLKTEIIDCLWREPVWQEVFSLLITNLDENTACNLIDYLVEQNGEEEKYLNIFLASSWLKIVKNKFVHPSKYQAEISNKIYKICQKLTNYGQGFLILYQSAQELQESYQIRSGATMAIASTWHNHPDTFIWLQNLVNSNAPGEVRATAIEALAKEFPHISVNLLQTLAQKDQSWAVRMAALQDLALGWPEAIASTIKLAKTLATNDTNPAVRSTAVKIIANLEPEPETLKLLRQIAENDENLKVQSVALRAMRQCHTDITKTDHQELAQETLAILKNLAQVGSSSLREVAVQELVAGWPHSPEVLRLLKSIIQGDDNLEVRKIALQELAKIAGQTTERELLQNLASYEINSGLREVAIQELGKIRDEMSWQLLNSCARKERDAYMRQVALQALITGWHDRPETLGIAQEIAQTDEFWLVRSTGVREIATHWAGEPTILTWLQQIIEYDDHLNVREAALRGIAKGWRGEPAVLPILKQLVESESDAYVQTVGIQQIARGWWQDPETLPWLKMMATRAFSIVRQVVVQELAYRWHHQPEVLNLLAEMAENDDHPTVRKTALQKLARGWPEMPETQVLLKRMASRDFDPQVRVTALLELIRGWKDDPGMFEFLCARALNDNYGQPVVFPYNPRFAALEAIIEHYGDRPQTLSILEDRARHDLDEQVRSLASRKLNLS